MGRCVLRCNTQMIICLLTNDHDEVSPTAFADKTGLPLTINERPPGRTPEDLPSVIRFRCGAEPLHSLIRVASHAGWRVRRDSTGTDGCLAAVRQLTLTTRLCSHTGMLAALTREAHDRFHDAKDIRGSGHNNIPPFTNAPERRTLARGSPILSAKAENVKQYLTM